MSLQRLWENKELDLYFMSQRRIPENKALNISSNDPHKEALDATRTRHFKIIYRFAIFVPCLFMRCQETHLLVIIKTGLDRVDSAISQLSTLIWYLTHLPHLVIIISVPILWNSDHKSAFCNFTSASGIVNLGGIGGNCCRAGNIDEYGSEISSRVGGQQSLLLLSLLSTVKLIWKSS